MRVRFTVLLALFVAACTPSASRAPIAASASPSGQPPVIVVGVDGFRRSYFDTDSLPVLHALGQTGVVAEGMIPSFPTLTFPNFYALATGLYPEHSGIVNNSFYDPDFHESFSMGGSAVQDARWWWGEPIWVTAAKHDERSGVYFWVGSEAPVGGMHPTYWNHYDGSVPFDARVDQVLAWLDLPAAQRPALMMVYFQEPDGAGHRYGPGAPETAAAAARVDSAIGRLTDGLRARGMYDKTNIIVVADHGMAATSPDRVVYLDDAVDSAAVRVDAISPVLLIQARDGNNAALLARLRKLSHITAWLKADVPARLHYNEGRRIPAIVAVADDGWTVAWRHGRPVRAGGAHGFDNANLSMRALFVAHGPAFRPGTTIPAFPNVDVYDLMAHLLNVAPATNDGTLAPFTLVLRTP